MFENVIGYSSLTNHFSQLVVERELPSVLLLSGPSMSGKKTIALEIARVLLCEKDGKWQCDCAQCTHSRLFSNPNVVLMGSGQMIKEIFCGKDMVLTHRSIREHFFLVRAISKLLRRADFLLWENSDVWSKNLKSPVKALGEYLLEYQEDESLWYDEKAVKKLVSLSLSLESAFPVHMLPVQCIRNVLTWTMLRSPSSIKVVIIDHVEDMLPASANMILKTLEEPPNNTYFILTSSSITSLLPTIRSRVREFVLPGRTRQIEHEVLQKVFAYTAPQDAHSNTIQSIQEYLDLYTESNVARKDVSVSEIKKMAETYFQSILHKDTFDISLITFPDKQHIRQQVLSFFSYVSTFLKELLDDTTIMAPLVQRMWISCEQARTHIHKKNINAGLELEVLFYRLLKDYELFT